MLRDVSLPATVTRTYFNCFEQQIMTLCYFLRKEFWKLFLDQRLQFNNQGIEFVEDTLKYKNSILENAKKYYGISLQTQKDMLQLQFEKKQIYLAYIDIKYYPHTEDIEEEGIHCILIYGEKEAGYIVNDNYYGEKSFILKKDLYAKGIKRLCLVQFQEKQQCEKAYFSEFINEFCQESFQAVQKSYHYILKNKVITYQSANLIRLISDISCFIKKDFVMAKVWGEDDPYLKKCISILDMLADEVRKVFYAVLKAHLKYDIMPELVLMQKIETIVNFMRCEEQIKNEIINILLDKENIKNRLHEQLLDYLEIEKMDEGESIYEVHDKLSVIYLLNYFEKCNQLSELQYEDFEKCASYLDFKLVIYEKIFLEAKGEIR